MMTVNRPISDWIPITKKEVEQRGWEQLDVIIISGDAYVDHPSFGGAVIARIIEAQGYKVAIIPQPNWRDDLRDFKKLGAPRLFFGITSGCMDSMINHYTANKRLRSNDAYTPGGASGYRPDYAATLYSQIVKQLYPDVPVILGGVEASLRRVTHYDYWSDTLMPSILVPSQADMLVYGMGDKAIIAILNALEQGRPLSSLEDIPQTAFLRSKEAKLDVPFGWETMSLHAHADCLSSKVSYASNFKIIEQEANKIAGRRIKQVVGEKQLIINPPYPPFTEKELDASFDLPYTRLPHPKYFKKEPIPAYEMIKHSINIHRGCFGGCSFCTISAHQGKHISSRSQASILKEVEQVVTMPDFKGYISDVGGPSANMYKMRGKNMAICGKCFSPSCIHPVVCKNLNTDHTPLIDLYAKIAAHPKVKKAFVGSGIRYDLLVRGHNKWANNSIEKYLDIVVKNHISGRLKVAPEHTAPTTLRLMRKPSFANFHQFKADFERLNKKHQLKQELIPYFISSHPGCSEMDMAELAAETKQMGFRLEQVQDFTPSPMTLATEIYYSGYHPYKLKQLFTAKTKQEKLNQHKYFFWYKKEMIQGIREALQRKKRFDLIKKLLP